MTTINGWEKMPFGEIAALVKGVSYASEDYCGPGQGAIFLTIKCVSKAGGFKPEGIKYFKGEIADSQELHAGDLLIANTDLTRAGDIVGAPIVVPSLNGETITMSMDLSKVVEDDGKIDRQFLYFVLMTDRVRRFMKDHASGSTVLHLQTRAVPTLEIDIPNKKPEQTKIAEILSTLDQAIDQTEALIAKKQRIKTGLMQDLLTRGIDENGNLRSEETHEFKDSPLGRIPVEWDVRNINSMSDFVTSGARGWAQYYGDEGAVFLRIGNLTRDHINMRFDDTVFVRPPGSAKGLRTLVAPGDVLISVTADLGIIGVIPEGFGEGYVNQHIALVRISDPEVDQRFVGWFLQSRAGQAQFERHNESGAKAGLNLPTIRSLLVASPPLDEQRHIAKVLDANTERIAGFQAELDKQSHLKTALMQDLLTGKVSVAPLLTDTEGGTGSD